MRIIEAEPAQGASAEATERPPRRDGAHSRPLPEPDRRSTLRLVLEDGGIKERGGHAVLLARGGAYAALWARQQADREAAD